MRQIGMLVAAGLLASGAGGAGGQQSDAVDVSAAKYAAGCPTPFDATGKNNDLCEVRNALADVKAATGYRVLAFPAGVIKIETPDLNPALAVTKRVSLAGAGQQRTAIYLGNSKGALLEMAGASDCNAMPGYCNVEVHDLTIAGAGRPTTGDVFDLVDTPYLHFWNVTIRQVNGFAVNLVNDTERSYFDRMTVDTTLGVRSAGDGNETYFNGVEVLNSGLGDGYVCYDGPQCNPDGTIRTSGMIYPNPHMAVSLDGVVGEWRQSSIKSTAIMGGLQFPPEGGDYTGGYVEGAVPAGMNTAVVAGDGKMELGHTTAAVTATATAIPVDDARWQKPYVTDPALAKTVRAGAGRALGRIYPADYDVTQSGPSAAVPGVARNASEAITVAAFAGDGMMYLQGARSGTAWPAGSIVEMNPRGTYGPAHLQGVHLNSVTPYPWNATVQDGCDDNAQLGNWTSSRSRLCAEVIVGPVPDGYAVPYVHQRYVSVGAVLHTVDNTWWTNSSPSSEQDGQGWIKIPGNGVVVLDEGDVPMHGAPSRLLYKNGAQATFLSDPLGGTALGQISDPSARYYSDMSDGVFDAWTVGAFGQPMQHWTLNAPAAAASVVAH